MFSFSPSRVYYGWWVVVAAFLMNVAASPTNAVAFSFFVTPMGEDLGWSRGDLSLGLLFRLAVAGVTSPVLGMLIDRVGARVLGTIAGVVAGLCVLALAFVQDLWMFYLLFAISGMSGFGGPAGQLLTIVPVSKWFIAHRGRALAIATVGMPLGTAMLVPGIQYIIGEYGWRTAWALSGIFVLSLAVPVCALLMRKDPESIGLLPDGAKPEARPLSLTGEVVEVSEEEHQWTASQVLRNATFWTLLASIALSGIVIQGTLVYRTSFWEDTGLSADLVAFGTALDPLTVVFSAMFFGLLAERVSTRLLGLFGGVGVAFSMVPMVLANGGAWTLFAHNLSWGLFMGANITVNNLIWPEYFGRRFLGTIRGMMFPVMVGSAAISTPMFALMLDESPREQLVWIVPLVAFVVSGALIYAARRPKRPLVEEIIVTPEAAAAS